MKRVWTRRRLLTALTLAPWSAQAMGRLPYGGTLRLSLPWPTSSLDPHSLYDPMGAFFGLSIADPLYALDSQGRPFPTLAEELPKAFQGGAVVRLRPNLRTAQGRPLDSRDVVFSLRRSRARAGAGLWGNAGMPERDSRDPLATWVPRVTPERLAHLLARPVMALLPRGFNRLNPDGTGAFRARVFRDRLTLERNIYAARGAAFLDRIVVQRAHDMAGPLRAFEAGDVDVGWLGAGLHRPRKNVRKLFAPSAGWIIVRTGRLAGTWGAPGVAQQLLDATPTRRLEHLGLRGLRARQGAAVWGGGAAELLVPADSPHLLEVGRALASLLSRAGNSVTVAARSRREIQHLRRSRNYTFLMDFVRNIGPDAKDAAIAMSTAANLAAPPTSNLRETTRTLPLGVLGSVGPQGAQSQGFAGLNRWDLGAVWKNES